MLDRLDPRVRFKLSILERAMPAESVIVFGDMYVVEGGYAAQCRELGAERVVLVDTFETRHWLEARLGDERLDFYKGDFSSHDFMTSIRERFTVSVAFDVLLHQPPLLNTLHNMLAKTEERIAIVQPMLKERELANTLVYLPGSPPEDGLYPMAEPDRQYRLFDIRLVNQGQWIWAMTVSFLRSVLAGEGFELIHEQDFDDLPNPQWRWWGGVAERRGPNSDHWSTQKPRPGVSPADW
jgi:hypothetical protein